MPEHQRATASCLGSMAKTQAAPHAALPPCRAAAPLRASGGRGSGLAPAAQPGLWDRSFEGSRSSQSHSGRRSTARQQRGPWVASARRQLRLSHFPCAAAGCPARPQGSCTLVCQASSAQELAGHRHSRRAGPPAPCFARAKQPGSPNDLRPRTSPYALSQRPVRAPPAPGPSPPALRSACTAHRRP